jgi:hypothetical protein
MARTLSKDFPLSSGIFTSAKITLSASTDADATAAILTAKTPLGAALLDFLILVQ